MGEHMPKERGARESSLFSLVTCSKCHKLLDSPRELDCGHIFCQECLPIVNRPGERQMFLLRQFSVVCLECGKFTHIPGKDVEKLPQAPWVLLLKTFLNSTRRTSKVVNYDTPCSGCKNPRSEKWCKDCDILLCLTCANSHKSLRKMKTHVILDKSNASVESRTMMCQAHGNPMKWLCQDCPKLLCFQCIHQQQCEDHNYENIANIVLSKRSRLQQLSDHIDSECDKLSDFLKSLDLYEGDKISLFEEYEEKVKADIMEAIEKLEKAKATMLEEIKGKKLDFATNLKDLRDGVEDKLKEYATAKDVIQTVFLPSHQMELALACPLLEKRINTSEPGQYRLREQIEDFNLIFRECQLTEPELLVKPQSLSPRRSPRVAMTKCSLYGVIPDVPKEITKDIPKEVQGTTPITCVSTKPKTVLKRPKRLAAEFFENVPPPLPERVPTGLDEPDKTVADSDSSRSDTPSTGDSGTESLTPDVFTPRFCLLDDNEPFCNSIIEMSQTSQTQTIAKTEKKRINPALMPAALPPNPNPKAPQQQLDSKSIFYIETVKCQTLKTQGYAVVDNTECNHPLPPSDKDLSWESILMSDGFEVLCLPNGNICVSFENGVKMYDPDGKLLKNQTVLGAKGMAYRPIKRDILVAGYHSNSIFALHDTSLTFKADLRVTLKKSEKPWSCAALSNGGFVVLYSKDDKYFCLNFYKEDGEFIKTNECGLIAKGPLHMVTDTKDLIFISDESNNQIVICYPNDNYIQTVIVDSPRGMVCTPNERGILFASNKTICQLKLSPRDGKFSDEKIVELPAKIISVGNYKDHFICLTDDDLRLVPR